MCNLSLKYQIRKLGDTKYQTGKYQIGKYLASFAWTSVAQLAEVSKPGIARERWPGRLFHSSESAFELLGGLSSLERSSETSLASLETGKSHRAKLTRGGSGTKQARNIMGSKQRGRFMKCNEIGEKLNCFGGLEVFFIYLKEAL